jgi:hypothetical protein
MRGRAGLALLAVAVMATSACTGSSGTTSPRATGSTAPQRLSWIQDATIPGIAPGSVTTDPVTGETYLGGSLPAAASSAYKGPLIQGGTRKPVLWERSATGGWHEARITVTSFYGAQATLASMSSYQRLTALGAVAGGAHANPRPSFFTGGPGGISEHEQKFDTWGGENAIGIVGVAAGPSRLLMVGQWAPDGHRASGALWTSADGRTYVRHDRIPGLGDSLGGRRTTAPLAASYAAGRFVVVGSVTDLTKPGLSIVPAVWLSDGLSVIQGTLSAGAGELGGPTDVACDAPPSGPVQCLAGGLLTVRGAQTLRAWRIAVSGAPASAVTGHELDVAGCLTPPPAPDPGSSTPRAATVRVSVGPDGSGWVVASTSRSGVACRISGTTARPVTLPAGCVPAAVEAVPVASGRPSVAALVCTGAAGVTTYHSG